MKHLAHSILLLICLTVLFASFLVAKEKQSKISTINKDDADTILLKEGVGVKDIIIDKSRLDDVIKTFGKKYKVIKHLEYSNEIYYAQECLSFSYKQNDKDKTIFNISAKLPCEQTVVTTRGIYLGLSNLQEVIRIYGGPPEVLTTTATETWFYEYPGVTFNTKFISWEEAQDGKEETFRQKIVTEIDIHIENIVKPKDVEDEQDNSELENKLL